MATPDHNFKLRSTEVQKILGQQPKGIAYWGTTVILCVIVLLIITTWIIRYPVIITVPVTIRGDQSAVIVSAPEDGEIGKIHLTGGDTIKMGENIAEYYIPSKKKKCFRVQNLTSPTNGTVYFLETTWTQTRTSKGQTIALVMPKQETYWMWLRLPENDYQKIKHKPRIHVRLRLTPETEAFEMERKISRVLPEPNKKEVLIGIILPKNSKKLYTRLLKSNFKTDGMTNILVGSIRLLEKITTQISLLKIPGTDQTNGNVNLKQVP